MKKLKTILFISFLACGLIYPQDVFSDATDYRPGDKYPSTVVNWYPNIEAAGDWCPAGMFPDLPQAAYFAASEWLGDTLYVQVPTTTGAASPLVFKYTFGSTWSTGVPLPVGLTGGTLTACNGKLYYFGGGTSSITTGSTSAYSYNPSTGAWTAVAPLPVALSAHGAVCWGDSVIFIVGGPYTGSGTNLNVHYYRVATNTWGTITNSLPAGQGRRTFAMGLADGNKIMIGAGYNTAYLKSVYIGTIGSNASQLTWTQAPDVPTGYAGLSRPGGTGIFKYFFVVGGERSGGGYHDTAYVYDATINSWVDAIAPKPFPTSNIFNQVTATAFDDSIRIFVPGGYAAVAFANFDVVACGQLLVVPVELTSFTASVIGSEVTLNWRTSTEVNNYGFQIERNSGAGFVEVGFVPGAGTISEPQLYSFADIGLKAGQYSYRLKQIDYDGSFEYTNEVNVEVTTPSVFLLEQNYPNPFNPTTTIAFSLAIGSKVSLKIFNTLGQEVRSLVNGNMSDGFHEVSFDASALNSGVYFYRIDATGIDGQNFSQVRKMILTK
jgi:N-acetylneuraminic acid mutarotase